MWGIIGDVRAQIRNGDRPPLSAGCVTDTQKDLLTRMWNSNPNQRPSFAEICAQMEMDPECRFPGTNAVAFNRYKEYVDRGETAGICSNEFQAGIWKIYREWTNMPGSSRTGRKHEIHDIIGVIASQFTAIAHKDDASIRRTHKQLIRSLFNAPEVSPNVVPSDTERAMCCLAAPPLLRRDPGFEQGARRAREWACTGDPKGICQYADILFLDGQYEAAAKLLWPLFADRNEPATRRLSDYFLHVDPMPPGHADRAHHFFDLWAAWPGVRPAEGHVLLESVVLHALFCLRTGEIDRAKGLRKLPPGIDGKQDQQYQALSDRLDSKQ
jgi:hypothetical protein